MAFIAAFLPNPFMDHNLTYMYFLGVVFAPICAIQIVDYYFFRHQRLDMLSLFDYSPKGRYHFWGGFNPAAFIATAAGCVTYWYLLDPVTYVSHNDDGVQVAERVDADARRDPPWCTRSSPRCGSSRSARAATTLPSTAEPAASVEAVAAGE